MTPFFTQAPSYAADKALLLLDRRDRIIGVHPAAAHADLPCIVGDDFFARFPMGKQDRAAFDSSRQMTNGLALLLHTGDRPILVLSYLYAATGLTVVALPEGEDRLLLDAPAAYFNKLPYVTFGPSALVRRKPVTEEGYLRLPTLMQDLCRPFLLPAEIKHTFGEALAQLAIHITLLAKLFDCTAVCQFQKLTYARPDNYCPEPALGAIVATLSTARRLTGGCELTVYGQWQEPVGPVLYITLPTAEASPEVAACMQDAHDRGHYFEVVRQKDSTELRVALCISELSAQGVRTHDLPQHYTEIPIETVGQSPASPSAPQEAIPLFQNGQWNPGGRR